MDRYAVEKNIGKAIDSIEAVFGTDKVDKSMRSKMSAFGAAVLMGGPLSAFAYYEKNEKKIPEMLAKMYGCGDVKELIRLFETGSADIEELLARSVSLKLALNLFISE